VTRQPKEWDETFRKDVEKILSMSPLPEPFQLTPSEFVTDPTLYHERLVEELKGGPGSPRDTIGSLKRDVQNYLKARGL
jgi:hypothetical protein